MPKTIDSYRTFIALALPADIRRQVKKHIERLRAALPDVRASWSREDNLHLTLKFLGNVPVMRLPLVSAGVEQAAHEIDPFELIVTGSGSFPGHGRPNVLWIGIDDSPGAQASGLRNLHNTIENECAKVGFPREPRPFHPHLTIARLRMPGDSRRLATLHEELGFDSRPFQCANVVVFKSELLTQGSRHTAISYHSLGGH